MVNVVTDDTSLNNIRVKCCDMSTDDLKAYGIALNSTDPDHS